MKKPLIISLSFLGGIIVGSLADRIIYIKRNTYGILEIDNSDPDKDVYVMNWNNIDDLDKIPNKKHVVFKIKKKSWAQI